MTTCEECHKDCKVLCCKSVGFVFPKGCLTKEQIKYCNFHEGIIVVDRKISGKHVNLVMVKTECKHLTEDMTCALWATGEIPRICRDGYNIIKRGVTFIPGCMYKPNVGGLLLTEDEIRRLEG